MRHQQQQSTSRRLRPGSVQRTEYTLGTLATVLTVATVLLLLAGTFVADWLRAPDFSLSASTDLLSPNNDRELDTASLTYTLAEDAHITARVFSMGGGLVRVLLAEQPQPSGQHSLMWDGRTETGAVVEDGQYRLEVHAAGTLRGTTRNILLLVDTTPPALQLVNLNDRARVGSETLTVQGLTDPGTVVWLVGEAQPLPVDAGGRFAFQRKLNEGSNLIELRAIDPAGNTAITQREVSLVTAPPDVALLSPEENAWLNQGILTVRGTASPGVSVTINDQPITLNQDGAFEHQLLLNEGQNRLVVVATDDVGNVTTIERAVYLKTRLPEVTLNVAEGATVSDALLTLVGRTEPGTTVTVNGRIIPVSTLGDFQASVFLIAGDNLIQVSALDQAGNQTQISRRVRLAPASGTAGVDRIWNNLSALPGFVLPVLAAVGLLLAFFFLRQSQVALFLSVDQTAFTPGLPGEDRKLELALDLNRPTRVTLEVLDADGNLCATLLRNRRRSGRIHLFRWDGYDDFGQPVTPGDYTIQATAGTPPIKVTSAVQVTVQPDEFVHRRARSRIGRQRINEE